MVGRVCRIASVISLLALVGCSGSDPGAVATTTAMGPTTTAAPTTTTTTIATPERPAVGVLVYVVRDEHVVAVRRHAPAGASELGSALEAMLAGPSADERAVGYSTAIPDGVALRSAYVNGGVAWVDLDRSFESGGGSLSMFLRLAQVTATAIAAPGVDAVMIRLDGEWVQTFSGEGIVLDHAWTRADIDDQLPWIAPEQPAPGDEVASPIRITGSANTFEAVFQVQVLDAQGALLADFSAMATSGTGTRGEFDVAAPVGGYIGAAIVRLLEYSAKDGSETNVIEIPVTLVDGGGVNVGP